MLRRLASDAVYSLRALVRSPGFVIVSLLAIVLGVTASTVVFSLIDAVLIRPLPVGGAERLVYMWTPLPNTAGLPRERQPFYSDVPHWRILSHSFENITAMRRYVALLNGDSPQRVGGAKVLGNFFKTLKVPAQLGRAIDSSDDHPGKNFVAVISDKLWHARFNGDRTVIGQNVLIDRQPYRVIGVMPRGFGYPHGVDFPGQSEFASLGRTDVWTPAALTAKQTADPALDDFDAVIGRLRRGVDLTRAQSEISAIEKRLEPTHLAGWQTLQALLVPFVETTVGPVRPLLRLLTGAVSLLLLMSCGNFASLAMTRAANARRQIKIRKALGASRSRILCLLLMEPLLLSIAGGVLATLLSYAALRAVAKINPNDIPRFDEATIDGHVLLFGLAVSLMAGLASGLFPAMVASSGEAADRLRQKNRGRGALLAVQVAVSVVLLTGAALLVRSYLAVLAETRGFSSSTLTMSVNLDEPAANWNLVRRRVMDEIGKLPGVVVAGSVDDLPLSTYEDKGFLEVEGYTSEKKQLVAVRELGGDYFQAMEIPLLAGRYLTDSDAEFGDWSLYPHVAVVSESFANRYFAGRNAIGHRFRINETVWSRIVGVVGDVRHASLEENPEPIVYYQNGLADSVTIRTRGPAGLLVQSIRKTLRNIAPGVSLTDIQTMDQYVAEAAARRRFQTVILTVFAGAAVFLTLIGLMGLLSYVVRLRTAEIGIRIAMGATPGEILTMIVKYGLGLTLIGLAGGICGALALTRVIASFLYGVRATDPATFALVTAFVILTAVATSIYPAWRAARLEPLQALRHEQ